MTLQRAPVKGLVHLFLDSHGDISAEPTDISIHATILAQEKERTKLGWKSGEPRPRWCDGAIADIFAHQQWFQSDTPCMLFAPATKKVEPVKPKEPTKIKDAKLGDRVRIYLDDRGYMSATKTERAYEGTIILVPESGHIPVYYGVGWKPEEKAPSGAYARGAKSLNDYDYVSNEAEFTRYFISGMGNYECEILPQQPATDQKTMLHDTTARAIRGMEEHAKSIFDEAIKSTCSQMDTESRMSFINLLTEKLNVLK